MGQGSALLRDGTQRVHARIETQARLARVLTPQITKLEYAELLALMHSVVAPLERSIETHLDADLRPVMRERSRTARLAHDLEALGYAPVLLPRASGPDASGSCWPCIDSNAAALGAWYVLEGANLGGRVIVKQLRRHLGQSIDGATRFYDGEGARTGSNWRAFQRLLDAALSGNATDDAGSDIDTAIATANGVFEALERVLAQDIDLSAASTEK